MLLRSQAPGRCQEGQNVKSTNNGYSTLRKLPYYDVSLSVDETIIDTETVAFLGGGQQGLCRNELIIYLRGSIFGIYLARQIGRFPGFDRVSENISNLVYCSG